MTDLSGLASLSGVTSFTYDAIRGLLYVTTSAGILYAWDPAAGSAAWSLDVGGSLSSVALSPDGTFVLVGDSTVTTDSGGQNHTTIDRVDLSSRTVTRLDVAVGGPSEQGIAHVAIASNGEALFTRDHLGSGWNPFREFSASASTVNPAIVSGLPEVTQSTYLQSSEHDRYILVGEANETGTPLAILRLSYR